MAQRRTAWTTTASTMRALALAALFLGVGGCSGDDDSPTAPPPPNVALASFMDPRGGFTTTDVRDAEGDIVRFTVGGSLVWPPTMATFGGFPVSGNFIGSTQGFEIRFGTEDGQRRAYFTERVPGTICDIDLINGMINVSPTSRTVPNP